MHDLVTLENKNNLNHIQFYIIIPSYNRAILLQRALQSILDQKYDNYHIFICNDGSSQDYSTIEDKIKNKDNITYLPNKENMGLNKNINNTLDLIYKNFDINESSYFFILDDDDYLIDNHTLIKINKEIIKSGFENWLCFNCYSKTLDKHTNTNYTEYKKYKYTEYRNDYRGDKHFVFKLNSIEKYRYPKLYKNGYEHLFYYKLPYNIYITPVIVKVIQYYDNGLSDRLYKTTSILDAIKHIITLPTYISSYKILIRSLLPKEIIKCIISPKRYYEIKQKFKRK